MNPKHTPAEDDLWHKIAALIMIKVDLTEIEFSVDDIKKLGHDTNIVLDERNTRKTGTFRISIVNSETLARMSSQ